MDVQTFEIVSKCPNCGSPIYGPRTWVVQRQGYVGSLVKVDVAYSCDCKANRDQRESEEHFKRMNTPVELPVGAPN